MLPFALLAYVFAFRSLAFPSAWWHNFERNGGIASSYNLPFERKRVSQILKRCWHHSQGERSPASGSWLGEIPGMVLTHSERSGSRNANLVCWLFFPPQQVLGSYMFSLWTCGVTLLGLWALIHALKGLPGLRFGFRMQLPLLDMKIYAVPLFINCLWLALPGIPWLMVLLSSYKANFILILI